MSADHGGGDHGHAKPKGGGGGHGGGGGGGGGSLTLNLNTGLLLFFGLPLAVLGLGWMVTHPGLVMTVFDAIIKIIFLIAFVAYRLTWTFPLLEDPHRSWLWNRTANLVLRTPALTLASLLILWLWLRTTFSLWHPNPGPHGTVGSFQDHILYAAVIAILTWVALNLASRVLEWAMYKVTGLHWPEPHAADH